MSHITSSGIVDIVLINTNLALVVCRLAVWLLPSSVVPRCDVIHPLKPTPTSA